MIFASNEALLQGVRNEIETIENNQSKNDIEVLRKLLPDIKKSISESIAESENLKELEFESLEGILDNLPNKLESKSFAGSFIPQNLLMPLRESLVRVEKSQLEGDIRNIKDLRSKLKRLASLLNALNTDDSTKERREMLEEELKNLIDAKTKKDQDKDSLKDKLKTAEQERVDIEKEIYNLEQGINTERIDNKLKILDALQKSVQQYKDKLIEKLKDELRKQILDNYRKLLLSDNVSDLEIDESFAIGLRDEYSHPVIVENQSSGQKQILAISIFWALSKLSHSRLPLIIDTPLSRIDATNRANIIQNYYAGDSQVIILPHSGEMTQREYEYAKPHLAGLYKIENQSNRRHATIKEARIEEIL